MAVMIVARGAYDPRFLGLGFVCLPRHDPLIRVCSRVLRRRRRSMQWRSRRTLRVWGSGFRV